MRLLKFVFTEAPPQFLPETKRFASVKDSSRFTALCDLPETIKNIFRKISIFSLSFLFFFKGFPLRKVSFLLFSVGEEWVSRLMRIPSGIFWRCKSDEILFLVLRMILLIWFSSKVRKCLRSTASPLCFSSCRRQFNSRAMKRASVNCAFIHRIH